MAITIRDVARAAGVSKTTAAYILSDAPHFQVPDETRIRVRAAAISLGYRRNAVAAALSSGRINTIGVFLPLKMGEDRQGRLLVYYKEVLAAIAVSAAKRNLRIMPVLVDEERTLTGEELADQRVDSLIVTFPASPETFAAIEADGLPCVGFSSASGRYTVEADNRGGAASAVDHLVGLGHRRIIHYTRDPGSTANRQRRSGFLAAMARHGLPATPEASFLFEGDRAGLLRRLRLPPGERPTAVTTYADAWALHVLDAALEAGLKVPEELSIVGFDDGPTAVTARPKLTTIVNPLEEMADACMDVLSLLYRGVEPPVMTPIPTRLVVRDSTAPVPPEP